MNAPFPGASGGLGQPSLGTDVKLGTPNVGLGIGVQGDGNVENQSVRSNITFVTSSGGPDVTTGKPTASAGVKVDSERKGDAASISWAPCVDIHELLGVSSPSVEAKESKQPPHRGKSEAASAFPGNTPPLAGVVDDIDDFDGVDEHEGGAAAWKPSRNVIRENRTLKCVPLSQCLNGL